MRLFLCLVFFIALQPFSATAQYTMPIEGAEHEGTWLQWPHNYLYGPYYRDDLKTTFVEMTRELVKGENVHIVAYDQVEKDYIEQLLINRNVPLDHVDFYIYPTDDCWSRDNGPIFAYDETNELTILDWGFNGWGGDTPYEKDDVIPALLAEAISIDHVDLNEVILEGGAFEIDGEGTFMATKSSILGDDRNPNFTQAAVETYLTD